MSLIDIRVLVAYDTIAVEAEGLPPHALAVTLNRDGNGTVGNTLVVVGNEVGLHGVIGAQVGVAALGSADDAAAGGKLGARDALVTVRVVEVAVAYAGAEGVAEGGTADVGDNGVDTGTVGAHGVDVAVTADTVEVVDVGVLLACVSDVDPALLDSVAFFVEAVNVGVSQVEDSRAGRDAHVVGEDLGALGELGEVDQLEGLDVAAALSVVESGSGFAAAYLYVEVDVLETAVLAVNVKPGRDFDALAADVAEADVAGIVDRAVLGEAGERGQGLAVGGSSAFGETPLVANFQILRVGKLEVEGQGGVVELYDFGALLGNGESGHDVVNHDGIGARAYAVNRKGNLIVAGLGVLVHGVGLVAGCAVTEIPCHGTALGGGVVEAYRRHYVVVESVLVAVHVVSEVHILAGVVGVLGSVV